MTIMNDKTREFVAMHRDEDVRELALKAKRVEGLDLPLALDQIAGWQIASKKLPQWASCEGIIYPPHISMEQCSSQFTAQYKSEIAQTLLAPAATVRARVSDSGESDNQTTKSEPQLSDSAESVMQTYSLNKYFDVPSICDTCTRSAVSAVRRQFSFNVFLKLSGRFVICSKSVTSF